MFELKNLTNEFGMKKLPIYNEQFAGEIDIIRTRPTDFADIDYWVQRTPEAIGIINELTRDVISTNIRFEAVHKTGDKEKIKAAKEFAEKNNFIEEMSNVIRDMFIYGDGALVFKKDMGRLKIKHLPMGTTDIKTDGNKIVKFVQNVSAKESLDFFPEETVHGTFMKLNGKLYGYSPMRAALPEIQTIGYIKDYAKSFFKKGGTPDFLFSFAKEQAGSPNAERLKDALKAYQHPSSNRGHLVTTGEINVEKLNEWSKDMEFRQMATYLVGVIGLGFNMPVSKIAQIVGADIKGSGASTDAEKDAYYKHINYFQTYWETLLNVALWRPKFGVNMRFSKSYLQDEVREAQRNMVIADYDSKLISILGGYNKKPSLEYIMRLLNLKEEDVEEGKIEIEYPQDRQQQLPDKDVKPGDAQRANATRKENETKE